MAYPQAPELALFHAESIIAIKQLQYRFGYFLDAGDWDSAAALLDENVTLALGHHHPRQGRAAVRDHLQQGYAVDFGLSPDHHAQPTAVVRANLQIMPVITVATDGLTAHGTWRHLGFGGGPGQDAYWTEGPQEVEYRYAATGWSISRIRWFRSFTVPYDGGWAHHPDRSTSDREADASQHTQQRQKDHRSWPRVNRPDFHFLTVDGHSTPFKRLEPVTERDLDRRVRDLESVIALENLQGMLGYYLDKGQWNQASALFTADARVHRDREILADGRPAIHALLRSIGPEGPEAGRLLDLIHLQPIITPAPDGHGAEGRWKVFAQLSMSGLAHEWGVFEVRATYRRTSQGWRISEAGLHDLAFTDYDVGWTRDLRTHSKVLQAGHHGGNGSPEGPTSPQPSGPPQHGHLARTGVLERLERVSATQAVERLQYIYGYCLAEFLWDELSDLFTPDGTIEIALRGVYQGRDSIRRSLELYGSEPTDGTLHNHMQFQPVIHISPDGDVAHLRCRAFSMMGEFGGAATWMGGIYENQLVRHDGQWKMDVDRVVNTYFSPYDVGWKDLVLRPAPGMSSIIPPDLPPSGTFEMYPGSHLVPYHYPAPERA